MLYFQHFALIVYMATARW